MQIQRFASSLRLQSFTHKQFFIPTTQECLWAKEPP